MQIHELNPFQGTLGSEAFLVVDNGEDTGKISVERLTQPINDRIDDIITSPAPTEQEIIDARRGWNEVVYGSLGTAIRSQVKQILAQFYKFNTYDLLAVYGTPISRTRNGVTFTWDDAGQVCEVSGEAVGGDAYASIYTQTGAWPGIFEHGVVYTVGYETTDPNVKLRIAVWEGVETTPDYYYFDEDGHFGIPPEAAKISIDLWVASGDTVSAVVKNVCMLRTYTAKEVTATIRDAMIGADRHMYNSLGDAIREQLNGKVDKVTGKVLSSNDFTDADKTKLDDVEAGAEVNAIEAIKLDGAALTPDANRAVDIPVDDTLTEEGVPADAKTVGEALETKANIDGYYETLTSGQTEQIIATEAITDTEPYIYRKTGGPNDVGDRVYDEIVGGSIVWNQLVQNGNFATVSKWSAINGTYTVSGNVATFTSTAANGVTKQFYQSLDTQVGHKHLLIAEVKPSKDTYVCLSFGTVSDSPYLQPAPANTWSTIAGMKSTDTARTELNVYGLHQLEEGDTIQIKNVMVIDLTAALTPTIADYIYSLEQTTAGAGVAWFRKYFPKEYFAYCEPHFEHVQTSAKETVGFNQWDEEWELGILNLDTGEKEPTTNRIRSKNYVSCLPNTVYYTKDPTNNQNFRFCYYAEDKTFISSTGWKGNDTFTTPSNAYYFRFYVGGGYGATYNHDICINLHGDRDGEYEAYKERTYPLDSSLTLRGIPKLDASNRLYFDGDVYQHDGTVTRRYGIVEASTLNWTYNSTYGFFAVLMSQEGSKKAGGADNFRLPGYTNVGAKTDTEMQDEPNLSIASNSVTGAWIKAKNTSYSDVASFKASLSGVYMLFELATPTTETAEPFQSPMVVDPLGTEEFVDYGVSEGTRDVAIPVGHTSEYPPDLRGKLQHLPGLSSSGDGRYVVVQTGSQMTLSPDTSLGLIAALEARVAALEGGNG